MAQLSLVHLSRLVGSENSSASLFPARQRPFAITSSHESEEVNQVILFHLLQEFVTKSTVTSRKALHPSRTKALFLLLSFFISRQAAQDFGRNDPKGCWIQITSISAYRQLLWPQICSSCLNTCCERQNLNLNRYQKSYGSHCLTPPNPDLSQLLISADRNIKVLEERIPHEIGRNMLTWPLVTCSIIIFQFQTASSRLQWVEITLKISRISVGSPSIVDETIQSETEK